MIVYVVTYKQLDQAFHRWISSAYTESETAERTFVYRVYKEFMASREARLFHTVTGLVSFPLDQWVGQFEIWINLEIKKQPTSEVNIRKWSNRLIEHLSSNWCLDQKLIVKECLVQQDFNKNTMLDETV